jgi:SAM-dependent methyltransferase
MGLVAKIRNTLRFLQGHGVGVSHATWQREYQSGHWEFLRGLDQYPRYCVLAGYARAFAPAGCVLDIGCGNGVLERALSDHCSQYVGIDLSENALAAAVKLAGPRATFVHADALTWNPIDTVDVIVFNEVLYYFQDPVSVLRRYENYLRPGGVFLVSIYWRRGSTYAIWSRIARQYNCLHETRIQSGPTGSWVVRVLGRSDQTPAKACELASSRLGT